MADRTLDHEIDALVQRYGIDEVIAALARYCHATGRTFLFRRLNKIYEWLKPDA